MPRIAEGRPAAEPNSPDQRARRLRILDSAAQLGAEKDLEYVQMHHVAQQAEVAIGTLYRYFPSKTHLFVGVMALQVDRMRESFARRTDVAGSPADRVFDVLLRATRAMLSRPTLATAMIQSNNSADAAAVTEASYVDTTFRAMMLDAASIEDPTAAQLALIRNVLHTWHGILQASLNGRLSMADAEADLQVACRLLLEPLDGQDGSAREAGTA